MGSERRLCLWTAASSLLRLGTFSCVSYRTACALVPLSSLSLLFSSRLSLSLSPPRAPLSSVPFSFSLSLSLFLFIIVLSRSSSSSSFSFRVISSSETKREKMCVKNERRGVFSLVSVFHKKQKTTHHEEHERREREEKRKEETEEEKRKRRSFFFLLHFFFLSKKNRKLETSIHDFHHQEMFVHFK